KGAATTDVSRLPSAEACGRRPFYGPLPPSAGLRTGPSAGLRTRLVAAVYQVRQACGPRRRVGGWRRAALSGLRVRRLQSRDYDEPPARRGGGRTVFIRLEF